MDSKTLIHVFVVSFPAQGHINPLLRLAKCLASRGLLVTFSTSEVAGKVMRKAGSITDELVPVGDGFIRFEFFEDGWPEDDPRRQDFNHYMPQLEKIGKEVIPDMIKKHAEENQPVSCLINNPFIPWVCDVGEALGLPCAMLWVHSCACFSCYYHYYHRIVPFPSETLMEVDVKLPCMPLLKHDEIPSFLHPRNPFECFRKVMLGQCKNLSTPFCILMDTFQELEHDVIKYMSKICPIKPVGPLLLNPKSQSSNVKGDFIKADDGCIEWLDMQLPSSVVYISFGSVVSLKQEQVDEIAHGLLNAGVSFLWAMKQRPMDTGRAFSVFPERLLEKAGDKGRVVSWSPQEQVLVHPSVACFMMHCGWNSTIEALTNGMPVIAFPHFGDQAINAKYLVEVFKVGIRMSRGTIEDDRIIHRGEVEQCVREATCGAKAKEMKSNALEWKKAAEEAVAEGGSSDRNMQEFVDEVRQRSLSMAYKAILTT